MKMRSRLRRLHAEGCERFVSISGKTFRRGARLQFKVEHPEFGTIMSGWFVADSNNPIIRHVECPPEDE